MFKDGYVGMLFGPTAKSVKKHIPAYIRPEIQKAEIATLDLAMIYPVAMIKAQTNSLIKRTLFSQKKWDTNNGNRMTTRSVLSPMAKPAVIAANT